MENFLDVDLFVDTERFTWEARFRDITQSAFVGELTGSLQGKIKKTGEVKVFAIHSSTIEEMLRGKGYGVKMYEMIIRKIFKVWPNAEVHSSCQLNKQSKGVWESLLRKYDNVKKIGRHYEVRTLTVL